MMRGLFCFPGKSHFVKKKVYILEWRDSPKNAILMIVCNCGTDVIYMTISEWMKIDEEQH